MDAAPGQRVGISAKVADEQEVLLCSLREGGQESANLDIVLDYYTEFAVRGEAAVHLAGYYMPAYEQDEGAPQPAQVLSVTSGKCCEWKTGCGVVAGLFLHWFEPDGRTIGSAMRLCMSKSCSAFLHSLAHVSASSCEA